MKFPILKNIRKAFGEIKEKLVCGLLRDRMNQILTDHGKLASRYRLVKHD